MAKIALISLSDKTGAVDFAKELVSLGFEIVSTGGTAASFRKAGLAVTDISQLTNFPECLDGRVKTLHPMVHAGILARPIDEHLRQVAKLGCKLIDLVCVNLYPFQQTVDKGADFETIVENIDIGGPSMLRSAAKNFHDVAVVVDPADYERVADEMDANNGGLTMATRLELARTAFDHTARYDRAIADAQEALRAGVNRGQGSHQLGSLLLEQGEPARALPYLEEAARIQPDSSTIRSLARCYKDMGRVQDALEAMGLSSLRRREPHLLSIGERKRLAVAGVLAMRPQVLVSDESTSMLDAPTRSETMALYRRLRDELGVVVFHATHRPEEMLAADRVLLLEGGRLMFSGSPRELFDDGELCARNGLGPPSVYLLARELERLGRALGDAPLEPKEVAERLWASC